eukprot:gene17324-19057_t
MRKSTLNKVEEEINEEAEAIKPLGLEDGSKLSPLHVAAIMGNKPKLVALLKEYKDDKDKGDKIGRTPLIFSILGDRYECAEALIKSGVDVNRTDVDERTALHWAAYLGNHRFVKLLLDKGARQGCQDKEGRTPLHLSLSHDNIKVMSKLLKDADIDCVDGNGMTPLHFSVAYERLEHTKMLLHAKASPDCQDNDKKTVLHWAKSNKEMNIVQKLLDYEPVMLILNTKDSDGRTALHLAVAEDNKRLVRLLTSKVDCSLSELDHMHRTPLHWAAILGHTSTAELLIERGSDPLMPDQNGVRPLHYAAQNNFGKTVNAMLQHENVKDVPDNDRRTALMWAAAKGAYDALAVLISHKQDILTSDKAGATALHMAAEGGHLACVTLLLQHQAGVNVIDKQQYTPLFCACQMGHREIVEALLLHGAAVDLEDREGRTPLHWAAVGGRTDICGMLLDHGLSPAKEDKLGRPALHYAAYGGFYTCMALLLEFKADVDARDNTGVTALHWACASGSLDAVKLLFRYSAFPNFVELEGDKLTPLDYAIIREHMDVAQFMMEHSAFTIAGIQDEAATVIQATWRGYRLRKAFVDQKQLFILHEKKRKETRRRQGVDDESHASKNDGEAEKLINSFRKSRDEPFGSFASGSPFSEEGKEKFVATEAEYQDEIESLVSEALSEKSTGSSRRRTSKRNNLNNMEHADSFVTRVDRGGFATNQELDRLAEEERLSSAYSSSSQRREGGTSGRGNKEKSSHSRLERNTATRHRDVNEGVSYSNHHDHNNSPRSENIRDVVVERMGNELGNEREHEAEPYGDNLNTSTKRIELKSNEEARGKEQARARTDRQRTKTRARTDRQSTNTDDRSVTATIADDKKASRLDYSAGSSFHPSAMSSVDHSNMKPWQLYAIEQRKSRLVRLKIESAIVIQRAFRKYLSRTRKTVDRDSESDGGKVAGSDDGVVHEIAALMIQLHWRNYLKEKLVKERIKEDEKVVEEEFRLLSAKDSSKSVVIPSQQAQLSSDKSHKGNSRTNRPKTRDSKRETKSEDMERGTIIPAEPYWRSNSTFSMNRRDENLAQGHKKSRPKSMGLAMQREEKTSHRSTTEKNRKLRSSIHRGSDSDSQAVSFKIHLPQSWSSNLQKSLLRN